MLPATECARNRCDKADCSRNSQNTPLLSLIKENALGPIFARHHANKEVAIQCGSSVTRPSRLTATTKERSRSQNATVERHFSVQSQPRAGIPSAQNTNPSQNLAQSSSKIVWPERPALRSTATTTARTNGVRRSQRPALAALSPTRTSSSGTPTPTLPARLTVVIPRPRSTGPAALPRPRDGDAAGRHAGRATCDGTSAAVGAAGGTSGRADGGVAAGA